MIERGLVVFSGIDTRIIDRIGPRLRSNAVDTAFVKPKHMLDTEYFDRLLNRAYRVSSQLISNPDVRITAILLSCLDDPIQTNLEFETFFPTLRRIYLDRQSCNDPNKSAELATTIIQAIKCDAARAFVKTVSAQQEARLLMPLRNCKSNALRRSVRAIFLSEATSINNRSRREVTARRGSRTYRSNDLDFKVSINSGKHPVRRCTDSTSCDFKALLRLGVSVPERLEFDVSCSKGLSNKTFYRCDGSAESVSGNPSHLNMRINDDYI